MNLRRISLVLLLCIGVDAAWRWQTVQGEASAAPPGFVSPVTTPASQCAAVQHLGQARLPMPEGVPAAHASTLTALAHPHPLHDRKALLALWFAGTRESAADVGIAYATLDNATQQWDAARWAVTRAQLQSQLGVAVRRLGNPMVWSDASGRLHLYVVATGLGGWAASRVVHLREAAPLQFEAQRVLPLRPLGAWFNTSTLVRALPLPLEDGGAVLPMYFELGIKYGLAVTVGPHGELRDVQRMGTRRDVLQPTLLAESRTQATALMRDSGPTQQVARSTLHAAAAHWHDAPPLALTNPDSSLAAVVLPSGEWVVAHNALPEGRRTLWLSRAHGGAGPWTREPIASAASSTDNGGDERPEYSYPSLLAVPHSDGRTDLWLSYTDQRRAISVAHLQVACRKVAP